MAKLEALEKRVAELKDWKTIYQRDIARWEKERKELLKAADAAIKFKIALAEFIPAAPAGATGQGKALNVNLEETQLTVNLSHKEKSVAMTTGTVLGKILFCALKELSGDGFSEVELSESLKEHGWNVGHSTLAPSLGGMVKDGMLVKGDGTRPAKYRLPAKLIFNVTSG